MITKTMQPNPQTDTTFQAINLLIWNHLLERDWHTSSTRGIATSIALEAAELLEHYQWQDEPVGSPQDLADELADVLIYCFQFAQANNIDMVAAIQGKLAKSAQKYPADKFKGKALPEKHSAWLNAKLNHRETKKGL